MIKKTKCIIFDLDGTLTDSKPGIFNSAKYALKKFDIENPKIETLNKILGPPLSYSFSNYFELSEKDSKLAVKYYREYFSTKGLLENTLYTGIIELLKTLKSNDYILAIATSKPLIYAEQIIKNLKIDANFDKVVGVEIGNDEKPKSGLIRDVLNTFSNIEKKNFKMVGDRKYDIIGANKVGIKSLGILYGYGSLSELKEAGADLILETVDDLLNECLK